MKKLCLIGLLVLAQNAFSVESKCDYKVYPKDNIAVMIPEFITRVEYSFDNKAKEASGRVYWEPDQDRNELCKNYIQMSYPQYEVQVAKAKTHFYKTEVLGSGVTESLYVGYRDGKLIGLTRLFEVDYTLKNVIIQQIKLNSEIVKIAEKMQYGYVKSFLEKGEPFKCHQVTTQGLLTIRGVYQSFIRKMSTLSGNSSDLMETFINKCIKRKSSKISGLIGPNSFNTQFVLTDNEIEINQMRRLELTGEKEMITEFQATYKNL